MKDYQEYTIVFNSDITLHNGDIAVNSKLNEGTKFTIILPSEIK